MTNGEATKCEHCDGSGHDQGGLPVCRVCGGMRHLVASSPAGADMFAHCRHGQRRACFDCERELSASKEASDLFTKENPEWVAAASQEGAQE